METVKWTLKACALFLLGGFAWVLVGSGGGASAMQPGPEGRRQDATLDDLLIEVARRAPGFGSMFIDEDGRLTVHLIDPEESAAAEEAIAVVFGRERIPPGGMRVIPGQYSFLQLKSWYDQLGSLFRIRGVVMVDMDDRRNRLAVGVEDAQARAAVERALTGLDVPREAVVIEETGPIMPVPGGPPTP